MLWPDTCGTGADTHTRFPICISFPAGTGAVAFAAAIGVRTPPALQSGQVVEWLLCIGKAGVALVH
jgi:aconitase B